MPSQPYYNNTTSYPVARTAIQPSAVLNTGIFGTVVGSTAALGLNLHKVQAQKMTMSEALADSLAKGAGAGIAAATATAATQVIGGGKTTNWLVLLATATGVGYAINTLGKKSNAEPKEKKK